MTTIDQLASQEQLHYQVIQAAINSLYLNLNSSSNSNRASIVASINAQAGSLGLQIYDQSNRVINSILGRVNTIDLNTLNTVRGLFNGQLQKLDSVQVNLQKKLDATLAITLGEIDKQQAIITSNLKNGIDQLFLRTDQKAKQTTDLITAIEGNLSAKVMDARNAANKDANNLLSAINSSISKINTNTENSVDSAAQKIIKIGGLVPGDDPNNPYNVLAKALAEMKDTKNPKQDSLLTFLIRLIAGNSTADALSGLEGADPIGEILKQVKNIGSIEENLINGQYKTLDDFNDALKSSGIANGAIGSLIQLAIIIPNIGEFVKALGLPSVTKLEQLLIASYSLKQLNENDLLLAYIRNNMSPSDVKKNLDNLGHSQSDSDLLMKNALPKYSIQELFRLAHLGKMDGNSLKGEMRELGWNEIDTILHGYLNEIRPGVNDLIQFAVKEVYSPEITNLFGQFQDFPTTFSKETALLGMSEDNAKKYWAAHWQLPGAAMGYDMYHRRIITLDQLKALLKALDVMPFWRDKLVNLAYNVVARVDTRRLYAYGIWDANKVYENYLDEGYKPEDAKSLTQFTIAYDKDHEDKHTTALKKKTHDVYFKSYRAGLIDKNQLISHVIALGYKREDIELEANLDDYEDYVSTHKPKNENHVAKLISLSLDGYKKKSLSRADLLDTLTHNGFSLSEANTEADYIDKESEIIWKETLIKEIQKLYFESLLDDNGVLTKLMQLGFTNSEALHIIGQLQTLKSLDDKKPTQAQFKAMFEGQIITENDYARELADMGYNAKYIPHIIALSR